MSMAAVTPALVGANKSAFKGTRVSAVAPKKVAGGRATLQVRTPAMRPRPHRARATDAARATIARSRTPPDARLDRNARASPASSSRRPRARAAAPDRATSRKREPSHRSRVQRVSRAGEDMPRIAPRASRGDREIPSAHAATRAALVAASAARVVRPSPRARPGARRARGARSPRASTGSLSTRCRLERAVALGPGAPNPGFPSHEPARRKSEKTFRVFSNIAVFFFFREERPSPLRTRLPKPLSDTLTSFTIRTHPMTTHT